MKSRTAARIVAASMTWLAAAWLAASCASSEDDLFPAEGTGAKSGASSEGGGDVSSSGGFGGAGGGSGGLGGTGGGGVGGAGGGAAGMGGTGGGAAGTAGTSGTSGTSGTGGTSGGSCNPAFCPSSFGTPCCLTPNGPCGCDMGSGCMSCGGPGGS